MSESSGVDAAFDRSRERFESVVGFPHGSQAAGLTHSELETRLSVDARELIRVLYQDHLDLGTGREVRLPALTDAAGICRGAVERAHRRPLQTVFGAVNVDRLAYRHRGEANLYPADAALNIPTELHSHGLRELAAVESARGSFDDARSALRRATGVEIGKRQVEQLAGRAAVDFAAYYERPTRTPADDGDVLVLSADGKGIVMRSDALRPAHREGGGESHRETEDPPVQGRETQPQTDGGSGGRLRRDPGSAQPHRHHRQRPPRGQATGAHGEEQVAHRERRRRRRDGHLTDLRRGAAPRPRPPAHLDRHGRRRETPDRPYRDRGESPPSRGAHRLRFRSRPRIHSGPPPGPSSPKATQPPRSGSPRKRSPCCAGRPRRSPPRSGAKPPAWAWMLAPGRTPTTARTTCSPNATTSTTAARSNRDGRSPPA